jgi:hypothetical protein
MRINRKKERKKERVLHNVPASADLSSCSESPPTMAPMKGESGFSALLWRERGGRKHKEMSIYERALRGEGKAPMKGKSAFSALWRTAICATELMNAKVVGRKRCM